MRPLPTLIAPSKVLVKGYQNLSTYFWICYDSIQSIVNDRHEIYGIPKKPFHQNTNHTNGSYPKNPIQSQMLRREGFFFIQATSNLNFYCCCLERSSELESLRVNLTALSVGLKREVTSRRCSGIGYT